MPKSENKKNKRKKGSSTDEELVNNSTRKWAKGGPSGESLGDESVISVSEILGEVNSVLYENSAVFDDQAVSIATGVPEKSTSMASNASRDTSSTGSPKDDTGILLKAIFDRLTMIESKLEGLSTVANKVENFEKELTKLWCKLDDFNKRLVDRVSTCESKIDNLEYNDVAQKSELDHLSRQNSDLRDELTYLKSQSMRSNLLFGGIDEPEHERPQDVEAKVRSFIVERLQLAQDLVNSMVIERAHRIGAKASEQNRDRSRMIVCKFANFKDRETVRKQGRLLKDTNFSIREQFPPEIVERRRKLFPQLRAAREAGKRAWLAYDTLYVDGSPVQQK